MAPNSIQLEDDQKFALMKFRRSVHEILKPEHDDQFLLRWLRARNWDTTAAEKMLRDSLIWRKKWDVENLLQTWQPPEALEKYTPSGCCGLNPDGSPVTILPFAGFDIYGMLHAVSKDDIIKHVIFILETTLEYGRKNGSQEVLFLIDMDNFNIRPYAWKPATELVITLIQMYEANYPEILKACYIFNAPSIFSLGFNVVKRFMGDYTISKIHIYKADPKKWKPILCKAIDPKVLPKYYGGEQVDPDGNPKCITKINQGGKVPKELYCKNQIDEKKTEFVTETIKKGKQLILDFVIVEEGCILKWDFKTDDHDIKFGITYETSEGEEHEAIRIHKVNSNYVNEVGAINCEYPATYKLIFDNTHSILRSKKLHYDVELIIPLEKLDVNMLPDGVASESLDTAM